MNYSNSLAPAHFLSADSVLIVEFRDLAWRFPRINESTYVLDALGMPWFVMATMVVRAMMAGIGNGTHLRANALEIFEALQWPMPDEADIQDMTLLLSAMQERIRQFTNNMGSDGTWVAVTTRGHSTVVFYKVKDVYRNLQLTCADPPF